MTRWTNAFSGLALVLVLAGSLAVSAQPGQEDGPGFGLHRPPMERLLGPEGAGRWWNNPAVIERLKLTDEQRKAMDQILLQHRESLIDMRANVEKAELAMESLLGSDQPNEQAILAQIDKVAQARAELEKANARFLLAIRAKLTPDQYKELQVWRNQQRDHTMWRDRQRSRPAGPQGPDSQPGSQPGPQPGPQGGPGAPPPSLSADPQALLHRPLGVDSARESSHFPQTGTVE